MRYFFLPLLLCAFRLTAQHFCHTTEKQNEWFAQHPELRAAFEKEQQKLTELDKAAYKDRYQNTGKSASVSTYTIPIVFHILHTGTGENISDAQVIDAVNILRRDYNLANSDTFDITVPFKHLAGNVQFDFELATRDTNGNCTNGIIRHFDTNTDWSGSYSNYAYTWNPSRYLNVYVVRSMGGGAAGYTYLPGTGIPARMDAIVILSNYVGSMGSGTPYTSRALTHEVGHWFNLSHTWGNTNSPGVACGDDGVGDTPATKGYTVCNLLNPDICTPGVDENVQNYMEYSYCSRMFTLGQVNRMHNAIGSTTNHRNNLSTSANLISTGITNPGNNCIPGLDIAALPNFTACSGTNLTISGFTYNIVPTSYSWAASGGASIASASSRSTTVLFSAPGVYTISCTAGGANGSTTKTMTVQIGDGVPQVTTTTQESFESSTSVPPSQWTVINPNTPNEKWEVINTVGSQGSKSMYVPGENMIANSVEILQSPSYDFKNHQGVQFSFKYAYAMQDASNRDRFRVQASKNCGATWVDVWSPTNFALSQGSGGFNSNLFFPQANQWKLKVMNQQPQFAAFLVEEHVNLRFYFQEDTNGVGHGNRFYLDEVNFEMPVGVNELTKAISFNVYPNPTTADFGLTFQLSEEAAIKYEVLNVSGSAVLYDSSKQYSAGAHELKLNSRSELSPGIYFVNLELNGIKMSRKVIVE